MKHRSLSITLLLALIGFAYLPAQAKTTDKVTASDSCSGYTIAASGVPPARMWEGLTIPVSYTITLTPASGSPIVVSDSLSAKLVAHSDKLYEGSKAQTWAHYGVTPTGAYTLTGTASFTNSKLTIIFTPTTVNCGGYTIGGTVSGLAGTGLVLQDNGGDSLPVTTNGVFTFSRSLANQTLYSVKVSAQPSTQICSVLNGVGYVASENVTNVFITCVVPPAGGTGTLPPGGGTVSTAAATVTAPPGGSVTQENITIATMAPPPGLPNVLASLGAAISISLDNPATVNAPFLITLPYDPTGITDESEMAVVHYDTTRNAYEPITILAHDTTAHNFQIDSRNFSPFVVVTFVNSLLDASHITSFTPTSNGWNIDNFRFGYFSLNGNCLGMSAYATWYFDNANTPPLNGLFSASGDPSIAQLVTVRAQLAQSQYWANQSNTYLNLLGSAATGELMKLYLDVFNKPLILLLQDSSGFPIHASVLYGYDATSFQFYDVNFMNASQSVSFDGTQFGTYTDAAGDTYYGFTYVAMPSLGRTEDFGALTTDALGGFTSSSLISVTSPMPGQQIAAQSVPLIGTLSSSINSDAMVIAFDKEIPETVANSAGSFSGTLPISNGDNTIILVAGESLDQQSNWYPNAAVLIFDVTGTLPSATLLTTLTWNQNNTDVDLYVSEPAPSGQTAWYANKQTTNLLTLDFDNTTGYGPEHTTLTTTGANAGTALPGQYPINVHYYSDHGTGQAITGTVSIVVNEGMSNQAIASQSFAISESDPNNALPGSTGPDWVAIGTVDLINGTITLAPQNVVAAITPAKNKAQPFEYDLKKPMR